MPDEYYERYRQLSHEELYTQLMAGRPRKLAKLESAWKRAEDSAEAIATGLRTDLARLRPRWEGTGSREFQYRIGLVVAFAQKLAEEAAAMRTGLSLMSGALADTQRRAEQPAPVEAAARPDLRAGGVLDGSFGHVLAADEQAKARERIAVLVARLAGEYALADHRNWPTAVPEPPPGLPGTVRTDLTAGLTPVNAVEIPDVEGLLGTPGTVPATELAGAGFGVPAAGEPGLVSLAGGPSSSLPAVPPPVALGGALPGLSGASESGLRPTPEGRGATGTGPVGAGVPPPVLGGAGAMGGGRPVDGYAITDPRLAGGAADWSEGEHLTWAGDGDSPPAVLGEQPPRG